MKIQNLWKAITIGMFVFKEYNKIAADNRIEPQEITDGLIGLFKLLDIHDDEAIEVFGIVEKMVKDDAFDRMIEYIDDILGVFGLDLTIKVDPLFSENAKGHSAKYHVGTNV
jgi:hypothetical protein